MNTHVRPLSLASLALTAIVAFSGEEGPLEGGLETVGGLQAAVAGARVHPSAADRALVHLADALRFQDVELLALALLVSVESEPDVCRTIALCQAPVGGARPLLGLLAAAFSVPGQISTNLLALACGPAVASGCIRLGTEDAPLPERSCALSRSILLALKGIDAPPAGMNCIAPLSEDVVHPQMIDQVAQWASLAPGGFVITGCPRSEHAACAQAVARLHRLRAVWLTGEPEPDAGAWLIASGSMPVLRVDVRASEVQQLPALHPYTGPWLWLKSREGAVVSPNGPAPAFAMPMPSVEDRRALWCGHGFEAVAAENLARVYRMGAGAIRRVAETAQGRRMEGLPLQIEEALACLLETPHPALDGLAERLSGSVPDAGFIAAPPLRASLNHLADHCRLRDGLVEGYGPAATSRYRPGVKALFHGPSGTGKSLAAQWLATKLGVALYRVDLASVTSKWIGETEKNLGQLLAAAEEANALLLFDEADALFGARTDISSSNDKFANSQTNYLLQRLEAHEGIVLLTTNSRDRMDSAFTRRLDSILAFPMPEADVRCGIWQAHLGTQHAVTADELERLAAFIDLSGGHIRNIVLGAIVAAAAQGELLGQSHVLIAANSEYAKLGRSVPREFF
jgi:ATPase family associated with various cellular activities (AAA)